MHLHRMKVDVRFMRDRLKSLREQIEEAQYRKFGCVVDMTELEQALLKRFIWDLRSSADEIRAEFYDLISSMQVREVHGCGCLFEGAPWRAEMTGLM